MDNESPWSVLTALAKNHINITGVTYSGNEPRTLQFEYQWRFTSRTGAKGTRVSKLSVPFHHLGGGGVFYEEAQRAIDGSHLSVTDWEYLVNCTAILYMVRHIRSQVEQ